MPNSKEEARSYFAAVGEQFEDHLGRHPSAEELISLCQETVSAVDREKIQSHLVQCDACVAEFKNINAFFSPAVAGEDSPSELERQREWGLLRQRLKEETYDAGPGSSARLPGGAPSAVSSRGQYWKLALVASLILALNLALWLFLRSGSEVGPAQPERNWEARLQVLEEENRRLQQQAAEIKQESERNETGLRKVEEENRRLQEQAKAAQQDRKVEMAQLRRPQVNTLVYDVLPQDFITRGEPEVQANRIALPSSKQAVTLILNGTGQPVYPKYSIEITDPRGRLLWKAKGVQRGRQGNFTMTLDPRFLRPGQYRLKLLGQSASRSQEIAEYRILVEKVSKQ